MTAIKVTVHKPWQCVGVAILLTRQCCHPQHSCSRPQNQVKKNFSKSLVRLVYLYHTVVWAAVMVMDGARELQVGYIGAQSYSQFQPMLLSLHAYQTAKYSVLLVPLLLILIQS